MRQRLQHRCHHISITAVFLAIAIGFAQGFTSSPRASSTFLHHRSSYPGSSTYPRTTIRSMNNPQQQDTLKSFDFSSTEEWDKFYETNKTNNQNDTDAVTEWHSSVPLDKIAACVKPDSRCLIVGCGNSKLPDEILKSDNKNLPRSLVLLDTSQNCLDQVKERLEQQEEKSNAARVEYVCGDATKLSEYFSNDDEPFDLIIDKGLTDAILCGEGWDGPLEKLLLAVGSGVLKNYNNDEKSSSSSLNSGQYLLISYDLPTPTKEFLTKVGARVGLEWEFGNNVNLDGVQVSKATMNGRNSTSSDTSPSEEVPTSSPRKRKEQPSSSPQSGSNNATKAESEAPNYEQDLELTRSVIRRVKDKDPINEEELLLPITRPNSSDLANRIVQQLRGNETTDESSSANDSKTDNLLSRIVQQMQGKGTPDTSSSADDNKNDNRTPLWIAIAGGPGSETMALTRDVCNHLSDQHGIQSQIVSMDGYLYSLPKLRSMSGKNDDGDTVDEKDPAYLELLRRRGSPHTINAEALGKDLWAARSMGAGSTFWFPGCESNDPPKPFPDPSSNAIEYSPSQHQVLFVVGDYLLLGAGGMVPGYVTQDESNRWKFLSKQDPMVWDKPAQQLFDDTWFVTCQNLQQQNQTANDDDDDEGDGEENNTTEIDLSKVAFDFGRQRERRLVYHLSVAQWTIEDLERMLSIFPYLSKSPSEEGFAIELANKKINSNDMFNMHVAETSRPHASLVIQNK